MDVHNQKTGLFENCSFTYWHIFSSRYFFSFDIKRHFSSEMAAFSLISASSFSSFLPSDILLVIIFIFWLALSMSCLSSRHSFSSFCLSLSLPSWKYRKSTRRCCVKMDVLESASKALTSASSLARLPVWPPQGWHRATFASGRSLPSPP